MQAMVAAVFSRLRHVPSEDELGARQSQAMASSVSLSEVAADVSAPGGPRMAAPDPRSAQIPAAGPSEVEDRNGGVPVGEVEEDLQDDGDTGASSCSLSLALFAHLAACR